MTKSLLRRKAGTAVQMVKAGRGIVQFLTRGEADHAAWLAMLNLHCRTNGRWTDQMTAVMRRLRPPPAPLRPFDGLLGHFETAEIERIAAQIRRDGYYVFEQRMSEQLCDTFAAATLNIEARTSRSEGLRHQKAKFDPANPVGYVYDLPEEDVWKVPSGQKFLSEPLFPSLAQAYFGATPALKDFNVWWSAVKGGRPDSDSAQMFHFDYDATPIWLKFFIYVTDVTPETGPHVFVRGSHRMQQPRMREMLSRGYVRISDEEIASVFGRENIIELAGRKGTVIAVDTLGYHKGKAPQTGARLVAQLEFATPIFAREVSAPLQIPEKLEPELERTMADYPWAFRRYRKRAGA